MDAARAASRVRLLLEGGRPVASGRELLLQRTLWDCGPAALHNLLVSLDAPTPGPEALARTSGTGAGGTTLAGLVRSARALGVPLRVRRPSAQQLASLPGPYLAWLREGHFVTVLSADSAGRLTVHDPGLGAYRVSLRSFRRRWGGVVAHPEGSRRAPDGRTLSAGPEPASVSGSLPSSHRR